MGAGLKNLSSKEASAIFASFGFSVYSQKGSHIKLRRVSGGGTQTLIVPERKQIPIGTLRALFRQASAFIPQDELRPHFYHE